jgi:hypothetical protein
LFKEEAQEGRGRKRRSPITTEVSYLDDKILTQKKIQTLVIRKTSEKINL